MKKGTKIFVCIEIKRKKMATQKFIFFLDIFTCLAIDFFYM